MIDTPEKPTEALPSEPKPEPKYKVWWIVGGAFTGAVLIFAMCVVGVWIWIVSSPEDKSEHTQEYTQALSGVEVTNEIGDIDVTGGDVVEVHRESSWRGEEPEIGEEIRGGDVLAVEADCDEGPFSFFGSDRCKVEFDVTVPAGVDAELRTSVGEIHLDGIEGGIDVESNVGDVEGSNLRAASTDIDSDVGSVRLEYAQVLGDIDVSTETGDVEIIVPDDGTTYAVVAESSVGGQDIGIATDPDSRADYVIRVSTSVGDLTVRYAD